MHGAQAVMPGVACLYRCVGGFVILISPTPIISGLRRTAERSPAAKLTTSRPISA